MASYHEVMDVNARSTPKKGAKVMKGLEHEHSANGGHVFTHRFKNDGPGYHEPETHTFGREEGRQALEHFAKHAGLSEHLKAEPEDDKDSAAGAAD